MTASRPYAASGVGLAERLTPQTPARSHRALDFLRVFVRTRMALPALLVLLLLTVGAIFAGVLAPYDPITDQIYADANQGPSAKHWLGTDYLGRDILSRLLFGARVSLSVAIVSVGIALSVGTTIGVIAGYGSGLIDSLLMRCTEAISAFPALVLALAIAAALGSGLVNAMIAIGIVSIPTFARLARAVTLAARETDYVTAGRALGATDARLIRRYLLPNIAAPLIVQASLLFGVAISVEAGLSFLGVGVRPPTPSWGIELRYGYQYLAINPILAFAPGGAIFLAVLASNFLGDALRTALDPRLKQRG